MVHGSVPGAGRRGPRRGALTAFVERHVRAWEIVMALLAMGYLAVGIADDSGRSAPALVLTALGIVLAGEFVLRCWDAPSRAGYARVHWLDAVSCVPLVGGLRAVRFLRLLRLGALARPMSISERGARRQTGERDSLWFLVPLLLVIWFSAALACWTFEHGVNPHVRTFGDALYWAFITVTTVGYGDVAPVSAEGRVLAGALVFVGVGLVGVASGRLTAHWLRLREGHEIVLDRVGALHQEVMRMGGVADTQQRLLEELALLRSEVTDLRRSLGAGAPHGEALERS